MILSDLRDRAASHGSVNVHLASAWSLRWHDPEWLAAWERWQKARCAWRVTSEAYTTRIICIGGKWTLRAQELGEGGISNPDPSGILDKGVAVVAQEFLESRAAYLAANRLFPDD